MLAFFNALSPWHLLLLGVVALLLFGNRLPEVARSMGKAVTEFKRGLRDVTDQINEETDGDEPPKSRLNPPREDELDGPDSAEAQHNEPEHSGSEERKSD